MRTVLLGVLLAACTGDGDTADSSDTSGTDTGDSGGDSGTDTWDGPTVTLTGSMVDSLYKTPVEGIEVCVHQPYGAPCTTTDAGGAYTLDGVPADHQLILGFSKAEFKDTYLMFETGSEDTEYSGGIYGQGTVDYLATLIEQEVDTTKAILGFSVVDDADAYLPDVTVEIVPAAGTGLFYSDSSGRPDSTLTVTSSAGRGLVNNVPEGEYELVFTHATLTCERVWGWPGSAGNAVGIHAIADGMVYVRARCI